LIEISIIINTLTVRKAVVLMVWKTPRDLAVFRRSFTGHCRNNNAIKSIININCVFYNNPRSVSAL